MKRRMAELELRRTLTGALRDEGCRSRAQKRTTVQTEDPLQQKINHKRQLRVKQQGRKSQNQPHHGSPTWDVDLSPKMKRKQVDHFEEQDPERKGGGKPLQKA